MSTAEMERLDAYLSRAKDVLEQAEKILGLSKESDEQYAQLSMRYLVTQFKALEEKTVRSVAAVRSEIADAIRDSDAGRVQELRKDLLHLTARMDEVAHRLDTAGAYCRENRKRIEELESSSSGQGSTT